MPPQNLESFQDRSFRFALEIVRFYRKVRRTADLPHHLCNQLLRSGTAIGAILAESKSAPSDRDLAHKQTLSLREGRECIYWLRIIEADEPQFVSDTKPLKAECNEIVSILVASVRKLKAKASQTPKS